MTYTYLWNFLESCIIRVWNGPRRKKSDCFYCFTVIVILQHFFQTHLELFQSNISLVPIDGWILHSFQVLMMTYGHPKTIFIFKFVRSVSDGFLFDLEACLINLKLP